jgi:uncharacterized membrane protein YhaH (DUF805 family)
MELGCALRHDPEKGGNQMEWATLPLKKYAEFNGRSRRKEYWMYVLLLVVIAVVIGIIEGILGLAQTVGPYGPLSALFALATFIPSLAVGVRRLHDTDRSGWWLLIGYGPMLVAMLLPLLGMAGVGLAMIVMIIALVGFVVLLIFMVLEGTKGPNQYGPDPKGEDLAKTFA